MSTRRIIGGCVTAMMIFQLSPAYAFQWGQWEIKPWGSVEEQYDSNITYAHTDTISDSITVPRLGLEGIYTGKNYTADLNLSGQEEIYSRYHHYDNLSEYLTANYSRDFSYYDHLKVDDSFVHATDPTTFVAQFGRTNGRYEYYLNDFDAGWTHDFTDKTSIQYKLTDNYYDPKLSGLIESNRIKGGVEGAWEVISELKVLVYADYSWRQFAGLDSITKESVGGGLRYYWTPRIYLEGKAGEDFIQPTVGNTDINRPDFQVSLNDQTDQTTLYTLSYRKSYEDTAYTQLLFNSWQAVLELKKDLSDRARVYASVFTGEGTYVGQDLKERLNGAGIGFIYHVTKNVDLRADYRFSENHSNNSTDKYRKQTGLLELVFKF